MTTPAADDFSAMRLEVGYRRRWVRFDRAGLMPVPSVPPTLESVHGDCIGADAEAHGIARECGLRVAIHPPVEDARRAWCEGDEIHMRLPYLVLNRDIVNATEQLIAAPASGVEERRSRTWAAVRYARWRERRVVLVLPDGRLG